MSIGFDQFKHVAKEYQLRSLNIAELEQQRKALADQIVGIKEQMSLLEPAIMEFMKSNEYLEINTPYGKIKYRETEYTKPVSKRELKDRLETMFANNPNGGEVIRQLFASNEKSVRKSLRFMSDAEGGAGGGGAA